LIVKRCYSGIFLYAEGEYLANQTSQSIFCLKSSFNLLLVIIRSSFIAELSEECQCVIIQRGIALVTMVNICCYYAQIESHSRVHSFRVEVDNARYQLLFPKIAFNQIATNENQEKL
jgi:hypothetical protein